MDETCLPRRARPGSGNRRVPDTYEDPERAYEEAKQALLLVSSLMNEGTQHLTKLEEFDEAQQTVKAQKSTL